LINGIVAGTAISTVAGQTLTTRFYSQDIYRQQQVFHSAASPAGGGIGGTQIGANVRVVLEVHDVDPANAATLVAASNVLYDGVISGAPAFCTYALVNSPGLNCSIAFTRLIHAPDTEVRSALPGQSYRTRLVGAQSSGAECNIFSGPTLDFFNRYVPALNELVEVHYRGQGRAMTRVINPASVTAEQHGIDNGVHGLLRHVKLPAARTSVDCENAALALLSDSAGAGWTGKYTTWSDFLPAAAADIFPGDGLSVTIPSRTAAFLAVVHEIEITCNDLVGDHLLYAITFADPAAQNPAFEFTISKSGLALNLPQITIAQVGTTVLPDLTGAMVTQVSSTTADLDAGTAPPSGGGIEIRWSDFGWGPYNDQNLAGRFTTQTFTLPRLAKVQNYYLRQFDASVPPKYSRFSGALHIDYPF